MVYTAYIYNYIYIHHMYVYVYIYIYMLYTPKNYDRHEMPMDRIVVPYLGAPGSRRQRHQRQSGPVSRSDLGPDPGDDSGSHGMQRLSRWA